MRGGGVILRDGEGESVGGGVHGQEVTWRIRQKSLSVRLAEIFVGCDGLEKRRLGQIDAREGFPSWAGKRKLMGSAYSIRGKSMEWNHDFSTRERTRCFFTYQLAPLANSVESLQLCLIYLGTRGLCGF